MKLNLYPDKDPVNLLPCDGDVRYYPLLLNTNEATFYMEGIKNSVLWKPDEIVLFGKKITTKRATAWYGSKPFLYTYSQRTKQALPFTPELLSLKKLAEECTGSTYNSCLLNQYHSGSEGMGWHSDDEKTIVKNSSIASISFGAERRFSFRHKKTKETVSIILAHGSLVDMRDETQTCWLHGLPVAKKVVGERINLTFRMMTG